MKRRDFMKGVGASTLAASGLLGGCEKMSSLVPLEPYKPSFTPNILFISVDDLNDWVGCLGGYPGVHTPNIDRLASQSQLFTNAHCPAPICNPSRTAIMFGLHPFTTGIYYNPHQMRLSERLRNAPTLQQYLMKYGYLSTGSGKIYHRYDPGSWTSHYPNRRSKFDEEYEIDPALLPYPENRLFNWYALENYDESRMSDTKTAHWVAEQLRQPFTQPTFLACGIYLPHLPWILPKEYFDLYPLDSIKLPMLKEDDLDDLPEEGRKLAYINRHNQLVKDNNWQKAVQAYLASISFMDAQLGKVLDALDNGPNKDNTLVVLWSDHGWHLGEKFHWSKYTLWEEATRIPLIFRVPGLTKAGAVCDEPVNLIDLYPTLLELAGLPAYEKLQGKSIVPLLQRPDMEWKYPCLMSHGPGNYAIRTKKWRYIRYAGGGEELYDHDSDPYEWINLASDPSKQAIKQELAQWMPNSFVPELDRYEKNYGSILYHEIMKEPVVF